MAYSKNNLALVAAGIGGGHNKWSYVSTDSIATVNTTGYISDGYFMGLRVQDTVEVTDTSTPTKSLCVVISASSSTGAVDLSDGTTIAQTNSD